MVQELSAQASDALQRSIHALILFRKNSREIAENFQKSRMPINIGRATESK